jgi:hypothetical protein
MTEERAKTPIIIPMSDLEPPWLVMKMGKRKKAPKLDTINRFAKAMVINDGL